MSLCGPLIVLILSQEDSLVWGKVKTSEFCEFIESFSIMLKVEIREETCVHVFEQYLSKLIYLLTNNKSELDWLPCLVNDCDFEIAGERRSFYLFVFFSCELLWFFFIHLIYGLV